MCNTQEHHNQDYGIVTIATNGRKGKEIDIAKYITFLKLKSTSTVILTVIKSSKKGDEGLSDSTVGYQLDVASPGLIPSIT